MILNVKFCNLRSLYNAFCLSSDVVEGIIISGKIPLNPISAEPSSENTHGV